MVFCNSDPLGFLNLRNVYYSNNIPLPFLINDEKGLLQIITLHVSSIIQAVRPPFVPWSSGGGGWTETHYVCKWARRIVYARGGRTNYVCKRVRTHYACMRKVSVWRRVTSRNKYKATLGNLFVINKIFT